MASAPTSKKQKRAWRKHRDDGEEGISKEKKISHMETVAALPSGAKLTEIDGSVLEGGGQILRNAVTLSCLLGKPVHITKIRAGRNKPGLRPQHLTGIQLVCEICRGTLTGGVVGSDEITFNPGTLRPGQYVADTKTAGSICLLMQAVLPCLLFEPASRGSTQVVFKGGTNADMAPPIDYLLKVFKPMIERCGVKFDCSLDKRGFYPKGGGQVTVSPQPVKALSSFEITNRGDIRSVVVEAFTAGAVPHGVGLAMCSSAQRTLEKHFSADVTISCNSVHLTNREATGNGSGILITACTTTGCVFGGSGIGGRNEAPETTGNTAAEDFLRSATNSTTCVDEYLQDQLIIFMALADGVSRLRSGPLTLHTKTAIHIAQIMTGVHFEVKEISERENIIECEGIGYNKK